MAGAIWINVLASRLHRELDPIVGEEFPANYVFLMPQFINKLYPWDTPLRVRVVSIYVQTHRYICTTGIIASVLLMVLAFLIKDASLEGPQEDEGTGSNSGDIELKEGVRVEPVATLRPSRLPILF